MFGGKWLILAKIFFMCHILFNFLYMASTNYIFFAILYAIYIYIYINIEDPTRCLKTKFTNSVGEMLSRDEWKDYICITTSKNSWKLTFGCYVQVEAVRDGVDFGNSTISFQLFLKEFFSLFFMGIYYIRCDWKRERVGDSLSVDRSDKWLVQSNMLLFQV